MKLVTFGDSWPYGSDLSSEEQPFGAILAQQLNVQQYINKSCPATSNDHMILQLQEYAKEQGDVSGHHAVFFITSSARTCFIDYNNNACEIRPDARADKDSLYYYYFKYFHTPEQEKFRHHITMLALQRMCDQLKIKDFYICGWEKPSFDFPGIDINRIYKHGRVNCIDLFKQQAKNHAVTQYISIESGQHPTQLGHQTIANTLYNWIKENNVQSSI
jgi:hypothetical protein